MRVFMLLFLLFPILELAVLIQVGSAIGVLPTVLLVIGTSLFGGLMLRIAGIATAWRAREKLARGELPDQEVLEGLMIAVGGGLLLLPGFISDFFGLLCLLPITRRLLVGRMRRRAAEQAMRQRAFADDLAARSGQARPGGSQPNVLEGEYERRD
ncbi:FxsA family protein [Phytopseudomonas dryadis]|uniref:Membrane protein FxsA n=1 Tax=Phytopseudomonas dryadis TaxID=2487520 RepID=A0A4Q9R7Q0_9GAMM|nr:MULTISPECIES: FxsA family protein [Pseudomonas]TBU96604.1 membrane protein FxsA [Pseudomonas dryadis]TBV07259.1 membrane protein FxsA [Pseudomonas dryadis]TBV17876.1 membrane protein FxsA [Pseudomonas sp. FRB 230]